MSAWFFKRLAQSTKGNRPDLTYAGGQRPIVHLQSDLRKVVEWTESEGRRWAFSNGNAGTLLFDGARGEFNVYKARYHKRR